MRKQTSSGMPQTRRAFIGQGALAFLAAAGTGHRAFGAEGTARLRFAVAPANCFGGHGAAIRSEWLTGAAGGRDALATSPISRLRLALPSAA